MTHARFAIAAAAAYIIVIVVGNGTYAEEPKLQERMVLDLEKVEPRPDAIREDRLIYPSNDMLATSNPTGAFIAIVSAAQATKPKLTYSISDKHGNSFEGTIHPAGKNWFISFPAKDHPHKLAVTVGDKPLPPVEGVEARPARGGAIVAPGDNGHMAPNYFYSTGTYDEAYSLITALTAPGSSQVLYLCNQIHVDPVADTYASLFPDIPNGTYALHLAHYKSNQWQVLDTATPVIVP